jgi:Taurine catabolism dioxygenase TauD, TfdA family
MTAMTKRMRAHWTASELDADDSWITKLDDGARADLKAEVKRLFVPGKPLLDYEAGEVNLGRAAAPIATAFTEALKGRGIALIKGLPRDGLSEDEFAFLTWMIGLLQGVARPQGKDSKYLHAVRNIGTDYRSPTGRGYSSNSELDFHIDGADLVARTCYNDAREGGLSMAVSNEAVYAALKVEYPELLPLLFETYPFSLQGEQPAGMPAWVKVPVFTEANGHVFIRWVRNRVESARTIEDAPRMDAKHWEALEAEVVRAL